ncbi:TetR/AcrR family transcriptional regulator [Nocardia vinacea]|uniref:TetR/AcrR family transcriptional regulator n=1 Tax=Nocardia vinacea TaxID=96468 RepID=A0ABZ1YQY2_9NOCA|nr:TetR/AcrR family transcriptional regulator [Nocardia vinacea]
MRETVKARGSGATAGDEPDRAGLSHKERLLRQGTRQFYANGFSGTTVDALLAASGVPKGSFYHHFGSKESFGRAVLERYQHFQLDLLAVWAAKTELATADKLTGYFGAMVDRFVDSGFQRACLVGKFSTEVAATSEAFRGQLDDDLRIWKSRLREILAAGQAEGDVRTDRTPDELADTLLALIQGAFVVALSTRDADSLRSVCASIPMLIT